MLLTFPMQGYQLVLGKFFASVIFFALALFATCTVPAMLYSLGDPDGGVIFSGYLGTFLLGAFFLSLGILFSGFFKDQIVAFAVTLLMCFLLFLLGTDFIAAYIDDRMDGLGSTLADLLGFFGHYSAFTRGVIDLADVLYFVAWTVIFLALNIVFIEGRNRPGAKAIFGAATGMSLAIGLIFNGLMAGRSLARADMTEDQIYTVSTAATSILAEVDQPVQVTYYVTPRSEMPTQLRSLETDVFAKLEELAIASGGKIQPKTVHLKVANVLPDDEPEKDEAEEETEEEAVEKRMLDKGVEPFTVRAMSEDQITNKVIYSSIGVAYKAKSEEIIPQIMPQTLEQLEYRLVSTVYKLTREEAPTVALVAPKEALNIDPQIRRMLEMQGMEVPQSDDPYVYLEQILQSEKYNVQRVDFTKENPLPEAYDTLVVVNPQSLNERHRWEINRALHSGKSVVMAVQQYLWNYQSTRSGLSITPAQQNPGVNEWLEELGFAVSEDILLDGNSVPITMGGGGPLGLGQTVNLPMHIHVTNESMDPDTSITSRLSDILYLWGTAIDVDEAKAKEQGIEYDVVMTSSDQAWSAGFENKLTNRVLAPPENDSELSEFPLMVVAKGQFPDVYAEGDRPEWPEPPQQPGMPPQPPDDSEPEPPAEPVEAAPGKLVLIGCSQMFRKEFLQASNLDLFLNCVDAVTLTENLVHVRGKKPINRTIERPTDAQKTLWRVANYGLANVVIALIGFGFFTLRRQSRNAYTMSEIAKQKRS